MLMMRETGFGQWLENPLQRSKAGELVNQIMMIMERRNIVLSLEDDYPKLGMMQYAALPSHSFVRKMFSIKKLPIHSVVRKMPYFYNISCLINSVVWKMFSKLRIDTYPFSYETNAFFSYFLSVWSKWNKCRDAGV